MLFVVSIVHVESAVYVMGTVRVVRVVTIASTVSTVHSQYRTCSKYSKCSHYSTYNRYVRAIRKYIPCSKYRAHRRPGQCRRGQTAYLQAGANEWGGVKVGLESGIEQCEEAEMNGRGGSVRRCWVDGTG